MPHNTPLRILNVMLGKGLGGIEQAALDYALGLRAQGHEVTMVTHPKAAMNEEITGEGVSLLHLPNAGVWDPLASRRLRRLVQQADANVVLAHGNRAMQFAKKSVGGVVPVVAVAHNYHFQQLLGCDAVLAITRHMMAEIEALGVAKDRIYHAPNMIRLLEGDTVEAPQHNWHTPPLIGSFGRFVAKKGFDVFLEALAILKQREVPFRAVLGGDGEEDAALRKLASDLGLEEWLEFSGWVDDASAFLGELDVFCLPSHHEPFGIVLLEAMAERLPIVSTDSEGPSEILVSGEQGVLVPKGKARAMADALEELLSSEVQAKTMAQAGYELVKTRYSMATRSEALAKALQEVVWRYAHRAEAG